MTATMTETTENKTEVSEPIRGDSDASKDTSHNGDAAVASTSSNDASNSASEKKTPEVKEAATTYSVFPKRKKQAIVLSASLCAVFSTLTAQTYLPALKVLADDFNVSVTKIDLTVTTYLIFQGVTPLVTGTAADSLGRRPAYIICFLVYLAANIGLACAPNYASLLGIRCLQAAGISGTQTLCQAVVADTVTSAERGQYIGFVTLSAILGPSLGPVIGGALTDGLGWRSIFWFLAICAGVIVVLMGLFFPETCRPLVGDGSISPPKFNMTVPQLLRSAHKHVSDDTENGLDMTSGAQQDASAQLPSKPPKTPFVKSLTQLWDQELIILLLYGGLIYSGINAISAALPSQFNRIYGYDSLKIGLIYLPMAGGSIVAVWFVGKAINWNYRRHATRIGVPVEKTKQSDLSNFPIEQARLEVLLPPLYFTAAVIIAWGWALQAQTSVAVPIVLVFLLGCSYIAVLNVFNTLITDLYRKKAGSAVAANWFVRCMFAAGMTAAINPMIVAVGSGWAYTIIGGAYVVFSPAIMLIMWKGLSWRQKKALKSQ